jgi:hypothetical protein
MRRRLAAPRPNARVAVDIDEEAFRELLLGRLTMPSNFLPRQASD